MSITIRSAQTIRNGLTLRSEPINNIVTSNLYANYDAVTVTNTSTIPDSSGNNRDATLFNSPTTATVNGTKVLQLDSTSNQYFGNTSGYGTDLDSAFTFDVWCYPTSAGTAGTLISEWGNGTWDSGWQDNQMGFSSTEINMGVYNAGYVTGSASWTANTWYHIVMTYDGSASPTTRAYVNAVEGGTPLYGAKASPGGTFLSMGLPSGADYLNGVSGYFNGYIGAWKIYDRALTAAEVTQNFNALRGRYGV